MKIGWKLYYGCMNDEQVKEQQHHIQKQQLILDFSNEEEARYWHKTASDFFYNHLLPPLSHLLDQYGTEDKHYFIDRLEIDVGEVYVRELQEAILKKVEDALRGMLERRPQTHQTSDKERAHSENQGMMQASKSHLMACLCYFLEQGTLPWNSHVESIVALETAIREEISMEQLIQDHVFQQRMHHSLFRRRFCFQFSLPWVREVFNHLFPSSLPQLSALQTALLKTLPKLASSAASQKKLEEELSENIIRWIGLSSPADEHAWPEHFLRKAVEKVKANVPPSEETKIPDAVQQALESTEKAQLISGTFVAKLKEIISSTDTPQDTKNISKEEDELDKPDQVTPSPSEKAQQGFSASESRQSSPESEEHDESQEKSSDSTTPSHPEKKIQEPASETNKNQRVTNTHGSDRSAQSGGQSEYTDKKMSDQETDERTQGTTHRQPEGILEKEDIANEDLSAMNVSEEYYFRYAGIILTWPYLSKLFDKVGYLEDKLFKDAQHQQRAVHLLGFIASGREQCEEPELVMPKFLCDWPLKMPVEKEVILTDREKEEVVGMLNSLINHWTALKNTSVEGLQASFFDREGKLFQEEEQWRLIVAQKSFDMLLDYLPYTIAVIKLPWMPGMLKVDWA